MQYDLIYYPAGNNLSNVCKTCHNVYKKDNNL